MSVMQVGVIGVIAAILAVQLKGGKTEYGIYVCMGAGVILFSFIVDRLGTFVGTIEDLTSYISVDSGYLAIMLNAGMRGTRRWPDRSRYLQSLRYSPLACRCSPRFWRR